MANRESLTWTTAILKENRTIVAASSAAVCSVLGGFPFDSIKTRMQTHSYKSMSDCIRQTYRAEGLRGFFRGIFPPLITVSIIKSVSFTVYLDSKTFFRRLLHLSNHIPDIIIASTLSGGIAGSVVSVISCPLEIVKIQRQLEALLRRQMECSAVTGERQKGGVRWRMLDLTQRSGSLAVGVDIVKSKGVKGLYRGFHLHLARDAIGTAIYFATYESVKRSLVKEGQTAGPSVHLISGALCGVTSWIFVFPIDLVKSVIQKGVLVEGEKRQTATQVARAIWKSAGLRGLYSGFSSTIARAVPIHSLNWIVYEAVLVRLEAL